MGRASIQIADASAPTSSSAPFFPHRRRHAAVLSRSTHTNASTLTTVVTAFARRRTGPQPFAFSASRSSWWGRPCASRPPPRVAPPASDAIAHTSHPSRPPRRPRPLAPRGRGRPSTNHVVVSSNAAPRHRRRRVVACAPRASPPASPTSRAHNTARARHHPLRLRPARRTPPHRTRAIAARRSLEASTAAMRPMPSLTARARPRVAVARADAATTRMQTMAAFDARDDARETMRARMRRVA